MAYIGEIISLIVAVSWTFAALFSEGASKRLGTLPFNVVRMTLALLVLGSVMWIYVGSPFPRWAGGEAWMWLGLSGLVGYVFGDICLFNSYLTIGSRFGQLFMTLAPIAAAAAGWALLGERMEWNALLGMFIVVAGIGMSVLNKGGGSGHHRLALKLPLKGVLYGIGAGVGQGVGLVLSKLGMNAYTADLAVQTDDVSRQLELLPFTSTFMRAVAGLTGFLVVMAVTRKWGALRTALRNRRGMAFAMGAVITGPTLGVSLSLMATLYTSAGVAQTLMSLTPVIILVPSYFVLKQKVTLWEVVGAFVAVAGAALFFV